MTGSSGSCLAPPCVVGDDAACTEDGRALKDARGVVGDGWGIFGFAGVGVGPSGSDGKGDAWSGVCGGV